MLVIPDGYATETLRLSHSLTTRECAKKAGVSLKTLIKMEKGQSVLPASVKRVSGVLGVSPEVLARPVERRVLLRVVA